MDYLYFLVSSLAEYNDGYQFHFNYFTDKGGFSTAFFIALITAAVFCTLFYFVICNFFNRLSRIYIWILALLMSIATTYALTSTIVIGGSNEEGDYSGFYESIEEDAGIKREEFAQMPEEKDKLNQYEEELIKALDGESADTYEVSERLYLSNCIYSVIFFIIFSILVKGTTKYGIAIPCTWPRKLHV